METITHKLNYVRRPRPLIDLSSNDYYLLDDMVEDLIEAAIDDLCIEFDDLDLLKDRLERGHTVTVMETVLDEIRDQGYQLSRSLDFPTPYSTVRVYDVDVFLDPQDDDAIISDRARGGYTVNCLPGVHDSLDEIATALAAKFADEQHWPNVWLVNERGDIALCEIMAM
jgi:hypothetical protein